MYFVIIYLKEVILLRTIIEMIIKIGTIMAGLSGISFFIAIILLFMEIGGLISKKEFNTFLYIFPVGAIGLIVAVLLAPIAKGYQKRDEEKAEQEAILKKELNEAHLKSDVNMYLNRKRN